MVVGHYTDNRIVLSYIYSFHMPAFFCISGYLYKPHPWWKTIVGYAIPVVIFSLVGYIIDYSLGEIPPDSVSIQYIVIHTLAWRHGIIPTLFKGVWFLWAFAGIRLLFGDIPWMKITRKLYIPLSVVAALYMTLLQDVVSIDNLSRGYYLGKIIPSLPFFCFGLLLRDIGWTPQKVSSVKVVIPIILLFIFIPATQNYCDIYNSEYGYSYIAAATIAMIFTLLLFWLTDKLPPSKIIETISKGTLVVLGTHMPILHILSRILDDSIYLIFPFATILVSYFIILLCEKYCPLLLGKWR